MTETDTISETLDLKKLAIMDMLKKSFVNH
jgi:hypothetical protein